MAENKIAADPCAYRRRKKGGAGFQRAVIDGAGTEKIGEKGYAAAGK